MTCHLFGKVCDKHKWSNISEIEMISKESLEEENEQLIRENKSISIFLFYVSKNRCNNELC